MISMMASMSVERPSGQKRWGELWKEANILLLKSHIWVWTISYCFPTYSGNCCFFRIWFNSIYNYLHCTLASVKIIQHIQWHNTAKASFHYFTNTKTVNDINWRKFLNTYIWNSQHFKLRQDHKTEPYKTTEIFRSKVLKCKIWNTQHTLWQWCVLQPLHSGNIQLQLFYDTNNFSYKL